MMKSIWNLSLCLALTALSGLTLCAQEKPPMAEPLKAVSDRQLYSLGKIPSRKERFPLQEITWPKEAGNAEVCLWKDDKYAAATICIDDNCRPDHEFWLEQCRKHGIKVTYFVIAGKVGTNTGFCGTWDDWKKMQDSGLVAIQSHSISHHKDDDQRSDDEVRFEYAASKKMLEDKLPGIQCLTLATPWGRGKSAIAMDYYVAIRGTSGTINAANAIDYTSVCLGSLSQAYIDVLLTGKTDQGPKWIRNRPAFRRGWISPLYHFVKQDKDGNVARDVANLASYKDRIWIDTFPAVALYAQERDSAELKTVSSTPESIELSLADRMCDAIFNVPLTLKVCLPDAWKRVSAVQDGKAVEARIIAHEGKNYALVQAVPDRGNIVLSPAK